MEQSFLDVTTEFLSVAFHNILYYSSIYPKSAFEVRKKYSLVVYCSIHPEVNRYIEMSLRTVAECLKSGQLSRLEYALTDSDYKPVLKFIFEFNKLEKFDHTADAYLIQCEQNIRAFCLSLSSMSHQLEKVPDDGSFSIYLHTTESTAVSLAVNPELENFPCVETKCEATTSRIVPLKRFSIRDYELETYIEL